MAGGKIIVMCGAAALAMLSMLNVAKAESTAEDSGGFAIQGEEFPTPDMSPELMGKSSTKAVDQAAPDSSGGASVAPAGDNAAGFEPDAASAGTR